jgi:hypothetical protein
MSAFSATARARASLEAVAAALRTPDLDRLLAAEEELSAALNALGRVRGVDVQERAAMHQELIRTEVALARCRTFGSALDAMTQATLVSQGRGAEYDRVGARSTRIDGRGVQVKARM